MDEEEEEVKTEEPSLKENKLKREGAMIETQEEKKKQKGGLLPRMQLYIGKWTV